jgi:signal transduction histidine kinase
MDFTVPPTAASELAAAFLQASITFGLALLFVFLYTRYRKRYFAFWAAAWAVYGLRLVAIITFLLTEDRVWLYWHQVATGWSAVALLWAALVFSQQTRWLKASIALLAFPPLWSYVAIYRLDNFLLAAGPAVVFLSAATWWTGWTFWQYHRHVRSAAAAVCAITLLVWGAHHFDYPFLRARGAWTPWGYYIDLLLALIVAAGILTLVLEDLRRGLGTLTALSAELHARGGEDTIISGVLRQTMSLAGVSGAAMFVRNVSAIRCVQAAGRCASWADGQAALDAEVVKHVFESGRPFTAHDHRSPPIRSNEGYVAALPVIRSNVVWGVMVIVGEARDPFAALDERFLTALGQQVGAAIESADLYRRLQARTQDLERLAMRMVQQHEAERRRLSRELHDETAQVFSSVKMQLGLVREAASGEAVARLDRILALVDEGIGSIRSVTHDLRPSLLDDLGLVPALRALAADFTEHSGLQVDLEVNGSVPPLSEDAELAMFRALQEGLSNVARHANARTVQVTISRDGDGISLLLTDDGRGLGGAVDLDSAERTGRMGLAGMRERISRLGGDVRIDDGPAAGVQLRVSVPGNGGTR